MRKKRLEGTQSVVSAVNATETFDIRDKGAPFPMEVIHSLLEGFLAKKLKYSGTKECLNKIVGLRRKKESVYRGVQRIASRARKYKDRPDLQTIVVTFENAAAEWAEKRTDRTGWPVDDGDCIVLYWATEERAIAAGANWPRRLSWILARSIENIQEIVWALAYEKRSYDNELREWDVECAKAHTALAKKAAKIHKNMGIGVFDGIRTSRVPSKLGTEKVGFFSRRSK